MKKIIAFALTLILLCSISSAFAANVVGTHHGPDAGTIEDGVDSFDNTEAKADVSINVQANGVKHRYAVDVEFTTMSFNLEGTTFIWDVNELQYVQTGEEIEDPKFDVIVYNYSDLSIWVNATISDDVVDDNLKVSIINASDFENREIASAYDGTATGSKKSVDFKVTATPEADKTWADVAQYYAGKGNTTVATCIVTISMNAF